MCSVNASESSEVIAALDALDAATATLERSNLGACAPVTRLRVLERLETARRKQVAISYDLIAGLAEEVPADIGGPAHKVVADWLRISCADARTRLRTAQQLAPRTTLTGQPLPPQLPATAEVWRSGQLDERHVKVIDTFVRDLPDHIASDTVDQAEKFLAEQATSLRPDQLEKVAARCAVLINPDGSFSDEDRARQRGFTWSPQRPDGMSIGKLTATPELRAHLDAWLARFAAPGCDPDDPKPGYQPSDEKDLRSPAQRRHDAVHALVRRQLGDDALGTHNGLPVTVIVSTTLKELRNAAGQAVTAGGTLLPIRDLIRLAADANNYLAVFDDHHARPLYLARARRLATRDQRLVLHAKDRGCTFPGCDAPGYLAEVHHTEDWAHGGHTNADLLTFVCRVHHRLLDSGWRTRKLADGTTEWLPPPHLPQLRGGVNTYHHPERFFPDDEVPSSCDQTPKQPRDGTTR